MRILVGVAAKLGESGDQPDRWKLFKLQTIRKKMGVHPVIDLSQLINEKVADIKIKKKLIESDRVKLKVKFSNGREKEIELKRFVNLIDLALCWYVQRGWYKEWRKRIPF